MNIYVSEKNAPVVAETRRLAHLGGRSHSDLVFTALRTWCRLQHTLALAQKHADAHQIPLEDLVRLAVEQYLTMHQEP